MEKQQPIEQAAAEVQSWRLKIQTIDNAIAKATEVFKSSERRRSEHALAASLGDAISKKRLAEIRQDDADAARALAELELARPLALAELAKAEYALKQAQDEAQNAERILAIRQRIAVASHLGVAFEIIATDYPEYDRLGQLIDSLRTNRSFGMNETESIRGLDRIAAALPKLFQDLKHYVPGATIGGGPNLAEAEAAHWGLPLEEAKPPGKVAP